MGEEMNSKTKDTEKRKLLKLGSTLSICNANDLRNSFMSLLQDNDIMELDMSELEECDSAGLQLLYSTGKTVSSLGKKLIISGNSLAVEDALYRSGMTLEMIVQ
jgi:anti-anti-sigma factor